MMRVLNKMFANESVNIEVLRQRAYNLRWATVGKDVIPLTAADPDFPCAPQITEAIVSYVNKGYLCYGPPEGLPVFRESLARFFKQRRNVDCSPAHLFPVDSAAFGIYCICKSFLSKGDEAIIFDPVDFLFRYSVEQAGATAVPFSTPPGISSFDVAEIEKLVTPATRMICLCNPLNPTGKVFTKEELQVIGDIAVRHDLIILSDEIWSDIVFSPNTFTSIASLGGEIKNHTINVTGFSKSYGLAGLRIGAVIAHSDAHYNRLFETSLHQSTIHGANVIGQVAAAAAMDHCQQWLAEFVSHLQKMRDICVSSLNSIAGVRCVAPQGCYVAFADITETGMSGVQMQELLLKEAKVAVVPGMKKWFGDGAEGHIRVCFATSEEILTRAMDRIQKTLVTV